MDKVDKDITTDLTRLPARMDRKRAAEVLTQRFFPISNRTLERWPLTWRRLNGRALVNTDELLAEAQRRLEECAPIKGGTR
jgi:hypothetical protein